LADGDAGNTLIVVHADSENGFVAGSVTEDYHGRMNNSNFEKWVKKINPKHNHKRQWLCLIMRHILVCRLTNSK
jgi:hypothetical protein